MSHDDETQGWIVWVQGDREPEQPFYCEEDAVNRAKEIAADRQRARVYIYEVRGYYKAEPVTVIFRNEKGAP